MQSSTYRSVLRIAVLATTLALAACSPKIDGTSIEAFGASVKELSENMTPEKARDFDKDLTTIMGLKGATLKQLREYTNDMSVKDVHEAAQALRAASRKQKIAQLEANIEKLEGIEAKLNAQKSQVAKFNVTVNDFKAQWYDSDGHDRPESGSASLSMTLQNKTSYVIKEFGYKLKFMIDGTEHSRDPWSYTLEKPLTPGESTTIVITDKKNSKGDIYSSISSRVADPAIETVKRNANATLSATIEISSITLADNTLLDANPSLQGSTSQDLKKDLAELTSDANAY